ISSPIPILFVSFNCNDNNCFYCGEKYVRTLYCSQGYCKKCLSHYITDITITDHSQYLDIYVYHTLNIEYRIDEPTILCFKQIPVDHFYTSQDLSIQKLYNIMIEREKYCKLCRKSLYQGTDEEILHKFKLCLDCYLISIEHLESTLTKKPIPIIYLPWWDNTSNCKACHSKLTFTSDCQKYCTNCFIFYAGCRYCLTTNIIFGLTDKSQCKKCKRVLSITFDIPKTGSRNGKLDDFLFSLKLDIHNLDIVEFANNIKHINKYFIQSEIHEFIYQNCTGAEILMEWISYPQFTNIKNLKEIAEEGFSIMSSPIPILFVSFNCDDNNCFYCGEKYVRTLYCSQGYCKKCLSRYISDITITDHSQYLDIYVYHTLNIEYRIDEPTILCFKQIPVDYFYTSQGLSIQKLYNIMIEREKYCKLCRKSLYQGTDEEILHKFKLCLDCYLISIEHLESTLTKKPIPIIYLPWWDNTSNCEACHSKLTFTSDCQKYCTNCFIFYAGCRYCLTTNIIFGLTDKSQCKKCERVLSITFDISKTGSGNSELDDFLFSLKLDIHNLEIAEFANNIKHMDTYFFPTEIHKSIYQDCKISNTKAEILKELIPYSQFTNIKE